MEKVKTKMFVEETLQRMTEEEKNIILSLFVENCDRKEVRQTLKVTKEEIAKAIDKFKQIYLSLEW